MPITHDPKYIVRQMQECADNIAINISDLENTDSIDEILLFLHGEVLPNLFDQIGSMHGLREKLRHVEYEKCKIGKAE